MGDTEEFKKKIFLLYQFGRQSLIFAFEYVEILPKNCWFNKGFKSIVFACIYQVALELADVSGKY